MAPDGLTLHMASPDGCNRAVIVSMATFHPGVDLGRRPGAQWDTKRLHRSLSKLGFKVDMHNDLSSEEIYELFTQGSARHNSQEAIGGLSEPFVRVLVRSTAQCLN